MYLDRISSAGFETPLITRDGLATQQWEAVLADAGADPDRHAWPSRPFSTWSGWLSVCFEALETSRGTRQSSLSLSPGQADRLWRHVIEGSARGAELIGSAGVARWAQAARRGLFEHGLAPAEQGGSLWRDDAAVFLDLNRDFEAELDRNGWVDPGSLLYRLNRSGVEEVAGDVILLDAPRATPEVEGLMARLRAAGRRIESIEPDDHEARINAIIAADPADEIRLAAGWAAQRLEKNSGSRLAVVIPDLEARRDEVETVFADWLGAIPVTGTGSRPVGDIAILGAAMTALRLVGGGGFEAVGRWLRSPFFSSHDEGRERRAAKLELALRTDPRADGDFETAWRRLGLDRLFAQHLPDAAQRLDHALRLPARATPTGWTAAWQSCLRTLGWQGFTIGLPARLQSAWDNAWARFSELTPITGLIDRGTALDALGEIVATESIYDPIALEGVTILRRPDQIGPGFSGVWLTGFTDQLPASAEGPNPLLPWAVQATLDMPGARPETALAASIDDFERLVRRVPEANFSCPARIGDEPRMPSPLIAAWRRASVPQQARPVIAGSAAARIGARRWQSSPDPAPAFVGETIPGGTGTLDLQSGCPVKAFCIARLRAEPVEPRARGIDPRLRGLLLHRALELVLDPDGIGVPTARVRDAVERAAARIWGLGDAGWQAQLRAERSRLERIVERLLEIDVARGNFATIAVEHRTQIPVGGRVVNCRIDRIDRLPSGETVLIDYKTGQSSRPRWFDERLGDCQLPLYAQGSEPGAIAMVRLDDNRIDYRWAGHATLTVPGSGERFDRAAWDAQIIRWREQIGHLLDEFTAGDVRVPFDAAEHIADDGRDRAGGAFAALTRIGDPR